MPEPRELELKGREASYGCSELGAILGFDPSQDVDVMYKRKVLGVVVPPTKEMTYGKIFEEAILQVACLETGKNFRGSFNVTYKHPEYPKYHLVGTPDALPPEEDENDGGLDCKRLSVWQRYQYGPTAGDMPPRVELQLRGYMALLQKPKWYAAVWCGDQLLFYTVPRDLEFEAFILDAAEDVWQRHFVARVPPPVGGSRVTAEWLQRRWPTHARPDIRVATNEEIALLRRYGQVRSEQKVLEKERAKLENQLKDAIRDREGLEWSGGRFTWRRTKDSTVVDWQSMAIGLRTFYIKDEDARAKLTEAYTHIEPGYRRIHFKSDEFIETEGTADAA